MADEVDYIHHGRPTSEPVVLLDFLRKPRQSVRPLSDPTLGNTVSLELLEAWPIKCAYAVQEMFKTESDYVKDLHDIIQGYRTPLSNHLRADNEGHQVISTLFCNVEEIFNLHKWLLDSFITHQADPHAFGQVFITSVDKFKIYSEYCTNYEMAVACLQELTTSSKDMDQFLRTCQQDLEHALPLSSQLIKPVQRIMRYHIMLKEVVKHFDGNHHGFHSLDSAHQAMVRIGNHINEVKKQKENRERVEDLQSNTTGWTGKNMSAYGELIIEDSCKVGHRGLERQAVLFEKLLLFVKRKDVKKYTYKAHIVTSELHIHDKFSISNPSMFKVSSLIHRHQNYVVDVGSPKKQKEWLDKMHALIRRVIDQAKMGRLMSMPALSPPPSKPPPVHPTKRRRVEEDTDSGLPELGHAQTLKEKDSSSSGSIRSRASRVLGSKKRPRADVRDLFRDESITSPKLQSYSVPSPQITSSCPPVMQTIPESGELGTTAQPLAPEGSTPATDPPPRVSQHMEEVSELEASPQRHKTSGGLRQVTSSTSMDSLLSLSDVDFGMEERADETDLDKGPRHRKLSEPNDRGKSKLIRRAAIKVKRKAGAVRAWSSSTSTSSIVKARAREAREASRSPPIEGEGITGGEDFSPEEPDTLLPFILDNMQGAPPAGNSDLSSSFSVPDSSLYSREGGMEGMDVGGNSTPVPLPQLEQDQDSVVVGSNRIVADGGEEEAGVEQVYIGDRESELSLPETSPVKRPHEDPEPSLTKISPFKRPRSLSHDQEGGQPSSHDSENQEQSVQVEIVDEEDELELGESCGQAKMRGRAAMPVCDPIADGQGLDVAEWEFSGTGSGSLEQSSSSYLGDDVEGVAGVEGEDSMREMDADFMIVEDSSDSEEEESVEDFDVIGEELEASLLEAVEAEEATLPEETGPLATFTPGHEDQVVPEEATVEKSWAADHDGATAEGANFAEFFSTLNDSATSQSPDSGKTPDKASTPVFHFEASPGLSRNVEIYGTLPRKKKGRSVNATPASPQKSASQSFQDPVRSSVRRAEGFSRLLEFTRQQQEEMEACRLPTFDVTQSMPVCANTALCDIEENEGEIQSGISETEEDVCLLGSSQTPGAEALRNDLGNAEESEGEIQSGLPETKDEVCLLGTSEIQDGEPSDRGMVPEALVTETEQQEAMSLESGEDVTTERKDADVAASVAPATNIEERGAVSGGDVKVMDTSEVMDISSVQVEKSAGPYTDIGTASVAESKPIHTDVEQMDIASRKYVVTGTTPEISSVHIETRTDVGLNTNPKPAEEIVVKFKSTPPVASEAQSMGSHTDIKLDATSTTKDTHEPVRTNPDATISAGENPKEAQEKIAPATSEGVVLQRNESVGNLGLWCRTLQTRLANLLPSRAGVLAFGVGVTAIFVFFALGGYFR